MFVLIFKRNIQGFEKHIVLIMLKQLWLKNELDQVEVCPNEQAKVLYGETAISEIGQIVTPTQVQNKPVVLWTCKPDTYYAIFMMDPDAPSRKDPKFREWYHWSVMNIPGTDIDKGETIAEYIGAGPPKNTGLHRYVLLVYQQQKKEKIVDTRLVVSTAGRSSQKVKNFATKYKLESPVAGTCFQAEWDDYVTTLYAKFK